MDTREAVLGTKRDGDKVDAKERKGWAWDGVGHMGVAYVPPKVLTS